MYLNWAWDKGSKGPDKLGEPRSTYDRSQKTKTAQPTKLPLSSSDAFVNPANIIQLVCKLQFRQKKMLHFPTEVRSRDETVVEDHSHPLPPVRVHTSPLHVENVLLEGNTLNFGVHIRAYQF
jgi:hypothetical protein